MPGPNNQILINLAPVAMRRLLKFINATPEDSSVNPVVSCRMLIVPVLLLNFTVMFDASAYVSDNRCVAVPDSNRVRCATDGGEFYTGEWLNGNPHGFGTYESDALKYVGEFNNGHFHGKGKVTCYRHGTRDFEGTFVDGNLEGGLEMPSGSWILLQGYPMCR